MYNFTFSQDDDTKIASIWLPFKSCFNDFYDAKRKKLSLEMLYSHAFSSLWAMTANRLLRMNN